MRRPKGSEEYPEVTVRRAQMNKPVLAVSVRWTRGYVRQLLQYFRRRAPDIHVLVLLACVSHLLLTALSVFAVRCTQRQLVSEPLRLEQALGSLVEGRPTCRNTLRTAWASCHALSLMVSSHRDHRRNCECREMARLSVSSPNW